MTIKITRLASRLMAMKYHTNKGGGHSHKAGAAKKEREKVENMGNNERIL